MKLPVRLVATLLALALAACVAAPQPALPALMPPGATAAPCDPPLEIPASIVAAVRAQFDKERTGPAPAMPPADVATYQKNQALQRARDWADLCRYRPANIEPVRQVLEQGPDKRRVVFMGDSITQNWGLDDPEFFASSIVNRGISGQTTPQMLVRFRADVVALRPAAVHIMAGTNDIAGNTGPTTLQAIEDNLATMAEIAKANHIKVILAAVPPAESFNWAPAIKPAEQIRTLNAWIKAYAADNDMTYADYYTPLATGTGGMKAELTLDGVHPNRQGYDVMRPIAEAAIARTLRR